MSFFLYSLPVSEPIDIEIEKCNENELYIRENDALYAADFFNVTFFDQDSRLKACDILLEAEHVQMEIDPLIHQGEPLMIYLFVDSRLFQKTLIEENLAKIAIEFPGYRYTKTLQEALVSEVMAEVKPTKTHAKQFDFGYLIIIGLFIVVLWQIINHI